VRGFLSADGTLDGAVLLGARSVTSLAAGATSRAVTTVTIPAATAPGDYRVVAVADALAQQVEGDETNNTLTSPGTVTIALFQPDLAMTALTMPVIAVTNTVRNAGPAPAGAFTVRFYLSADATLDAGDTLLGARAVSGLAAGAASSAVTVLALPEATAGSAPYRVLAIADTPQAEMDETNNVMTSTVAIAVTATP
jgi:subtilase family serine protease